MEKRNDKHNKECHDCSNGKGKKAHSEKKGNASDEHKSSLGKHMNKSQDETHKS